MRYLTMAILILAFPVATFGADRPNVVFILADDLGFSDTTLYGTTRFYQTPNIERLAARGMTFTHAYAASPLCSPTRAAVLTGLHPARTGITSPVCHLPRVVLEATPGHRGPPGVKAMPVNSVTRLKPEYFTLAEALKAAGYATGHFGKWHLGHEPYSPLEHGFDVDVPHWPGPGPAGSYVAPWRFPDFDPDVPDEHIDLPVGVTAPQFKQAAHPAWQQPEEFVEQRTNQFVRHHNGVRKRLGVCLVGFQHATGPARHARPLAAGLNAERIGEPVLNDAAEIASDAEGCLHGGMVGHHRRRASTL